MADIYNNPVIPPSPTIDDYYNQSMQRIQRAGLTAQQQFIEEEPQPTVRTAKVALDAANNKLFIGGHVVDRSDDTNVAMLSKYANQDAPLPEGNWEEVDAASFAQYVQGIRDPSTFKLMAKNFSMGVDEMQQMAGLGLQWLGAESAGQYLADQEADLAPNQVYSRNFTDIGSTPESGVLDWMAATIGRLGPNVVESVISAAAGAAIGGAVSGPAAPAAAPIGAIAGFFGKTAVKKALLEASKKRLKGEALDAAEKKLLLSAAGLTNAAANAQKTRLMSPAGVASFIDDGTRAGAEIVGGQVARRAAQVGGAAGLSTASNIFQQTGSAYGETMADGSEGDRGTALLVGTIGGMADTIPEFLLAGRLFSDLAGDVVGAAKKQKSALDLLKGAASGRTGRIAGYATAGAAIEGATEGFQEVLQIAANPILDLNSPEASNRIINAFAAGALMGGTLGGAGGAFAGSLADNRQEANLLLPVSQSDPNFTQYREDLKKTFSKDAEKQVNAIYPPNAPRPANRPTRGEFDRATQQQQDAITGMGAARQFAGQPPVPLSTGTEQSFQAPPAAAMPTNLGDPNIPMQQFGMSGAAPASFGAASPDPTVYAGQPLPTPPAPQVMSMGGNMTPGQMGGATTFEQFQAAAMQQAMAAAQAAAAPAAPADIRTGIPQPAAPASAPLPGGESINARLLRRGATPQAAPRPDQGTIGQAVQQGPLRMAGQAPATMVAPLRPTSVVDGLPRGGTSGQATASIVPPLRGAANLKRAASPKGGREDALAFLATVVQAGQNTFTAADLGSYLFPAKTKLNPVDRNRVDAVINGLVKDKLVSEGPIGVFTVDTEKVRATTQPGARSADTGNAVPLSGDREGGKSSPANDGSSGKAGKGNRVRKGAKARAEEPAPEGQVEGVSARTEPLQEADNKPDTVTPPLKKPVVVETKPPRKVLKKPETPPDPKGEGVAAAPSTKAADETTAKPLTKKEKAAAKKAALDAQKYENLSEKEQLAIAKEAERQGEAIATAMEREQDIPDLPPKATKEQADLYEVYGTIGNIILAQRDNQKKGTSVKDAAKQSFISNVGTLYGWLTTPALHQSAKNAAQAYLDTFISASETVPLKQGVAMAVEDARKGNFMLSSFDLAENPIDDYGRPAKGVNPLRARSIVDKFRRGLAKAPQIFVYKNQDDLMRRNPDLYQRAVAARPQGDFDTAPASGYAFDNTVLVFTDRIPTEKYMRFLLAHEAIGHFGMRSLLPAKQFDALMDYVYDNNPKLQLSVDAALGDNKSLGARREAVEEYMARFAETLDNSILARVWSAIKDVLNKLGVKFEDDIVRYLVSQARSTVRNGSSMFTPSTFALNLQTVMTNNGTGRFSTAPIYTQQHSMMNARVIMDAAPANLGEVKQALKDWSVNSGDTLEVVMRNVFRLRNYNALRNHGAQAFEHLKDAMRTAAQSLRNTWNERLSLLLALSGEPRRVVSYAMVVSRRIGDRRFALDKELRNAALLTLGDERPDGMRELAPNQPVLDKLIKLGTLSKEELDGGAEVTYDEPTGVNGKTKKVTVRIKGVKEELGRDLTDEEYDLYVKTRRDLAELDIERLKAQYDNFFLAEKVSTRGINKILADKSMSEDDTKFVKGIVNHAKKLFVDDIEYDERGMPDVSSKTAERMEQFFKAVNTAVVKKNFTEDLKQELRKFYLPKPKVVDGKAVAPSAEALSEGNKKSEAAIEKLEEFRSRRAEFSGREEQSVIYTLQDRVKEIVLADAAFERAQMYVRRSVASSHVPLWREGSFQVRVEAQINGKPMKLHPEVQNKLLYSLHTDVADAESAAKFFNDTMKDIEYSGLVYNEQTGEYKTQTFKVFARPSKTVDTVASEPSIDIDNFLYTSRVLGIPLAPDKHADAIVMLTAPGSALRKSLRFDDTPGYDPAKTVEAIARHVTTRSSLIARTRFQPLMRELMDLSSDSGKRWFGDAEAVMTAKNKFDTATDEKSKSFWEDKLRVELYKYTMTNPGAKGWDGSRASFPGQPDKADLGMRDYTDAVKEMEWLTDAANISESTFEGKRYAALLKMITSVGFLGGMFTQFAQNLMSPATNVLPYLASKDSQTGFGGGFGAVVMPTYLKAFKDVVGLRGLNPFTDPIADAKEFEKIAAEIKTARDANDTAAEAALVQKYSLSFYEATNIAREIRDGKLIPAQANAMLETARGIFTGPMSRYWLKFSDVYMAPFNVSEQATRRATFLTAFRLEFNRLKEAGFNEDKASEIARGFAIDAVDKTLGEYSNTNRPPVWRDGLMSMLFVYKTYPLTSLLLFKNLSRAGKIGMLTSLYVLAGAAGFPLVDDLEDLIDTLSQRMGLDIGQGPSVRMAIIRQLEEFFPGWSDIILRGPMNHFTGADVGAKFGLENFIPGTGILLKGANTTEELKSIAGPVFGMGLSMTKFLYDLGRAPLSSTTSLLDATREAPMSLVRAAGDAVAYMQNGAVVDRRGYVVSPEVSAATVIARILGFYPADAARQYDFIKYANRMNYDYKEVGVSYRLAWVKAMMTGDRAQAARIVREVSEWNEANSGGPGYIRNFVKNAQKALQEARRPAGERFLKAAPVASRGSYDRFLEYITE
jgi:hypothetical protein